MHVAFDIDGTLTSNPEMMRRLISSLRAAGHQVSILTGSIGPGDLNTRQEQLKRLGIFRDIHFRELCICEGANIQEVADGKGVFCRDLCVDMIFEDSPLYLTAVRRISPTTVCWITFPQGGP